MSPIILEGGPDEIGDAYATVDELKARMSITHDDFDTQLGEALSAASRGIDMCCDRQFSKALTASARLYCAPSGATAVEIDDFYSTDGLIIKTDAAGDGTFETTWVTADYELRPRNGIVGGLTGWPYSTIAAVGSQSFPYHYSPFSSTRACLEVTALWGWLDVPAPVKEATLVGAEELYKLKDAPFGVAGFDQYGAVRVRENPIVHKLVAPYRRHPVLVG